MRSRATSTEELLARIVRLRSAEGIAHARRFRPRPSDVIIATFPKAGTTWMQQIVHGLRTRGDMTFSEITAATPWIEMAHDMGWDLSADQAAPPRVFKSHWNAEETPDTCRRICVVRDPFDTMLSFYHFLNGWILEPGAISADVFTRFVIESDVPAWSYWQHLLTFWRARASERVLLVTFEDLKQDHGRQVRRVAEFVGLGDDETAIEIATQQSTFEFMKAHESQFDDHLIAEARNAACGLPENARSTKVRTGRVGDAREAFEDETRALLNRRWAEQVEPETGLRDYAALRAALAAR